MPYPRILLGFRARLLITMLAIVLITVIGIAGLLLLNLFEAEKSRAREQLNIADGVAREVLARRTELLASRLKVLVEDFGFRSAVASGDLPTMTSALDNHSARAKADMAVLANNQGLVVAGPDLMSSGTPTPFQELLAEARNDGYADDIQLWQGRAYQLIVVPVQGAGLKAWLIAGFLLDDALAGAISDLTASDVVFQYKNGNRVNILASSLPPASFDAALMDTLARSTSGGSTRTLLESGPYFSQSMTVNRDPSQAIHIVMLSSRDAALDNYYTLAKEIGIIVLAALGVAGVLVLATARAFGRPVLELANFASAIGEGRPATPPKVSPGGELGVLKRALMEMLLRIREREHRLEHKALHDELTGLQNRKAIDAQLAKFLRQQTPVFALAFALADFKAVNDTLGFAFGDQVIIATGLRLRGQLPPQCHFGRTGGNEFMALVPNHSRDQLEHLIMRLKAHTEDCVVVYNTPIHLQIHVAVISLPEQGATPDEVRRRLNLTMEIAPQADHQIAFYRPGGDESHLRELRLIRDLHPAMANGDLFMHYQPKITLQTVELHQVEALVRWHHPELGFVNPDEFILLAERSGQIHQLTGFILRCIADDACVWRKAGLDIGVAINLSALDLTNRSLADMVISTFASWQDHRERITFEVTESAVMLDAGLAIQTLEKLRGLGFRISIDDFGTGYSSLAQLRSLPVDELKIDKSFVLKLATELQDQLIVQSTIDMAHRLGLRVVAEGIEDPVSWHLLQQWGCDMAQGFYLGRPMKPELLSDWAGEFCLRAGELAPETEPEGGGT
ncbi:putative bifunctional diguanylate cyclase/phosphodiesterase [Marinobacter salicampi]|uniref:putative bifunctional diguanylate cyclase/phosphodiesterase n=1 Tax=Marinobacter salicampi TaxID=435907 RepID=UPI00140A2657|nr:GGDEF and EAL domain-containing protein [Marinobacter salicampi]